MKEIVIKSYLAHNPNNTFRLHADAAKIIRDLQRLTGMTASYILSEMVRQAKDYVVIETQDDL